MNRSVRKTDDDAAASKLSALRKNYFEDKYLPLFAPKSSAQRLPLINIGTYCRVLAVKECVSDFLDRCNGRGEIVSLGAGSDTLPFHLLPKYPDLVFHELDFPETVERKEQIIASSPELNSIASSSNYYLTGMDLRKLPKTDSAQLNFRFDRPTLVLSECCLCYLKSSEADAVLQFFSRNSPAMSVFVYEPLLLSDSFGTVMIENFAKRGISMPTIETFPNLDAQKERFKKLGLHTFKAADIYTYYRHLPPAEKTRISHLEFLDEIEEMQLLLTHYCFVYAY